MHKSLIAVYLGNGTHKTQRQGNHSWRRQQSP